MGSEGARKEGPEEEEGSGDGGQSAQQASDLAGNPNPAGSYASEGRGAEAGGEQKPTRSQLHLHDAGSLASVVSIGRSTDQQGLNFGIMDHLGFDAYEAAAAGFGNGVSLTLGLQHQQQQYHGHGGVNVAAFAAASPSSSTAHGGAAEYLFMAGDQQMGGGVHSSNGGQYGAGGMASDTDAAASQYHRGLSTTGFHLLRDLAG